MKLYVTILQGDTAHTAEPVIVTSDDELLSQIAELLRRRIAPAEHPETPQRWADERTETGERAAQ